MTRPLATRLISRQSAAIQNLHVELELAGAGHVFLHGRMRVTLSLPSKNRLPSGIEYKDSDSHPRETQNDDWRVNHWIPSAGRMKATEATPKYVVLECQLAEATTAEDVPGGESAYQENPIGDYLAELQAEHGKAHRGALKRWLEVARWRSGIHTLGRDVSSEGSYSQPELKDSLSGSTIRHGAYTLTVARQERLTADVWHTIEKTLQEDEPPPLGQLYFSEGKAQLAVGDIRRAIIDFAIAAEIHMKEQISALLPQGTNDEVGKALDRLEISTYWRTLFPGHLDAASAAKYKAEVRPELQRLFENRNDIVHQGRVDASVDQCRQFGKAVDSLLQYCPGGSILAARSADAE